MVGQTEHINGIQMYCEVHSQGEPLVLLHGFTGSGGDWEPFVNNFAAEYQLIIPDLRGHGGSTNPYLSTITARTLIVHGDRDPFYPVNLAIEMYNAIPRSYLWIVPNGGHGPISGDMAEGFVESAAAFLRGDWERE